MTYFSSVRTPFPRNKHLAEFITSKNAPHQAKSVSSSCQGREAQPCFITLRHIAHASPRTPRTPTPQPPPQPIMITNTGTGTIFSLEGESQCGGHLLFFGLEQRFCMIVRYYRAKQPINQVICNLRNSFHNEESHAYTTNAVLPPP